VCVCVLRVCVQPLLRFQRGAVRFTLPPLPLFSVLFLTMFLECCSYDVVD
jgi:hypothetical protein